MTKRTPMAIVYDFDGTLAPGNMQDLLLDEIGHKTYPNPQEAAGYPKTFWQEVKAQAAAECQADEIRIYPRHLLAKMKEAGISAHRQGFQAWGRKIKLFAGLPVWFERINTYGQTHGVDIQHYIVSSGNTEIIEGTKIASYFECIHACEFRFENAVAVASRQTVNSTDKPWLLHQINKDAHVLSDSDKRTPSRSPAACAVPFSHMVYIGDSQYDIPCFCLLKEKGGLSLAVFDPGRKPGRVLKFYEDGCVNGIASADCRLHVWQRS